MEQDYGLEIENLKKEMKELKEVLLEFTGSMAEENPEEETGKLKYVHPMNHMHPDPKLSSIMRSLCKTTDRKNRTGSITYLGVFNSGGRQSNWIRNAVNTDDLLTLIENRSAAAVLQCIGNNDRLTLLLALLRAQMTVAAMVEKCGFNTTGQVYHHLKPLIAADLVCEAERGIYAVKPHRVQGIIMLLAGISDLIDTKQSKGSWATESKES